MSLPQNVLRTRALEWDDWQAPLPFGGREKSFRKLLPLVDLGFHLEELPTGLRSAPLHDHLFEEELFYVLGGVLTVSERTPDGARREFELHAGELIAYPGGTRLAHAFSNRGPAAAIFLALSDIHPGDICTYPDSDKTNFRGLAVGAWFAGATSLPGVAAPMDAAAVLAAARARSAREPVRRLSLAQRPPHVAPAELAERALGEPPAALRGELSRAAGARAVYVQRERIPPGCAAAPLYRHRFSEEAALVLSGRLVLRQQQEGSESRCELEPHDLVHWPARGAARQLRNESSEEASVLVFGTARPWNVIEFPETGELDSAALGERGRLEPLDYFAGEAAAGEVPQAGR